MPLRDPTVWFDDLSVYVDNEELIEQAAALEPTLHHEGSRVATAIWITLVSLTAGAFGGCTVSDDVRASWPNFLAYLLASALVLRSLHPLSRRLRGPGVAWQASLAFFWSCLLAIAAVSTGRIDTAWLAYSASVASGLFIGLMYGSFSPGFVSREEVWMLVALPLGAVSTASATRVQRAFDVSGNVPWSEVFVGTMAASVFMIPMAVLMATLSSQSRGFARMATLYLHNDDFTAKAIEYLDQAIALSPRSAEFYNLRGIAYSKLGDGDRAEADFQKVSELDPRAAEAHMNVGVDFMKRGDFERSIQALQRAIAVNPKHATAFSNLGTSYLKKGDLDAAIESYGRAIGLRARYPIAFANRAYAYHLKGEHDLAIADATRAIKLDPSLPMAHTNLGHARAAKGEAALAARSYRHALTLSPDREVEEETLAALAKLGVDVDDEDDVEDDSG